MVEKSSSHHAGHQNPPQGHGHTHLGRGLHTVFIGTPAPLSAMTTVPRAGEDSSTS